MAEPLQQLVSQITLKAEGDENGQSWERGLTPEDQPKTVVEMAKTRILAFRPEEFENGFEELKKARGTYKQKCSAREIPVDETMMGVVGKTMVKCSISYAEAMLVGIITSTAYDVDQKKGKVHGLEKSLKTKFEFKMRDINKTLKECAEKAKKRDPVLF